MPKSASVDVLGSKFMISAISPNSCKQLQSAAIHVEIKARQQAQTQTRLLFVTIIDVDQATTQTILRMNAAAIGLKQIRSVPEIIAVQ